MNDKPGSGVGEDGEFKLPRGLFSRVCGVAAAAGVASGVIIVSFEHASRFSEILRDLEIPMIYSYSIAIPSAVLLCLAERKNFARRRD